MRTLVVENKSTGEDISVGSPYWKRLIIDPQVSMYNEGAISLGYDAVGVLFNVLRKPMLQPLQATPLEKRTYTKPTKKEPIPRLYANQREVDETPEEFFQRLIAAIGEKPDYYYRREVVVRLETDRVDNALDVWQTAGLIRDSRRLKVWPRNPDQCMQYGRTCDYFSVCTGATTIDDPMLFRVRTKRHEELDAQGEDVLTQSSIRCYRACARRFFFRYEMLVEPTGPKPEPLRMGSSLHRGLEHWWKSGGDIQGALLKLDNEDPYDNARERAMMIGYHTYWGKPSGVISVEKEWSISLVNPDTGAASRTFVLGGKTDAMIEDDGSAGASAAGSIPVATTEVSDGGSETHTEGDDQAAP
jgi:hypothetical protein